MAWVESVILVVTANLIVGLPQLNTFQSLTSAPSSGYYEGPTKLLQAFGIPQPGIRRWHSEPPQYMLDLYNQVADPNGLTRLPGPYGATVIRAFSEKEGSSGSTFMFSLDGLEEVEHILEAELHIHHSRLHQAHKYLFEDNIYILEVSAQIEGERLILAKQQVVAHSSGWRVFQVGKWILKVTTAKPKWDEEREELKVLNEVKQVAFQVTATTQDGRLLPVVIHHGFSGTRGPLLILFSTYSSTSDHISLPQLKNEGVTKKYETPTLNRLKRSVDSNQSQSLVIPTGCERRDMMVDFESIGWASWIVHPSSYNAYQCLGQCSFPLSQDLNPTNHATVQSIMNGLGNYPEVQRPCCVPSTYGNLSLLYYDDNENVVLKLYDKMVATECGCH